MLCTLDAMYFGCYVLWMLCTLDAMYFGCYVLWMLCTLDAMHFGCYVIISTFIFTCYCCPFYRFPKITTLYSTK